MVDPLHILSTSYRPLGPERSASIALTRQPPPKFHHVSPWLRWAVDPRTFLAPLSCCHIRALYLFTVAALKLLVVPPVLYSIYTLFAPFLDPLSHQNPFASFFQISGYVDTSKPDDPRYAKSYHDLIFLAYHVVFFSCVRQFITINLSRPIAKYFGLKRESKIDRFGEQMYALVYFMVFGVYGYVSGIYQSQCQLLIVGQFVMSHLPTYWYRTQYFWIGSSS
jgi:acyl-CoA-dependent ceramide synthase